MKIKTVLRKIKTILKGNRDLWLVCEFCGCIISKNYKKIKVNKIKCPYCGLPYEKKDNNAR